MKSLLLVIIFISTLPFQNSKGQDMPDIKFNVEFNQWQSSCKLIGISTQNYWYTYEYIKPISKKFLNHKIGKLLISVHDNIVVRKVILFIPNKNDIDVPKSMIDDIENSFGYKCGHADGSYGFTIDGTTIGLTRIKNALSDYKDRIMFLVSENHK